MRRGFFFFCLPASGAGILKTVWQVVQIGLNLQKTEENDIVV